MKWDIYWKEKKEAIFARFQTTPGIIDFFIGTAIWSYIIVNYSEVIFNFIRGLLDFLTISWLNYYVSALVFGIFTTALGLGISYGIYIISDEIVNGKNGGN